MAASTGKVSAKISALESSLDDLEAQLEPLFAQTLPESVVGLEKIEQAKLQVALPYVVYDLVFSKLRVFRVESHDSNVFSLPQNKGPRSKDAPSRC